MFINYIKHLFDFVSYCTTGLVFENIEANKTLPAHIRYKIRQNATVTPTTKRVRDKYWYPGPGSGEYPYYSFGFLWIQVSELIINSKRDKSYL